MFAARAALLIAIGVLIAIGETAAISAAASPAVALEGAAAVSERVLWRFAGAPDDGDGPGAALIADKWGNLYGTTTGGGANSCPQSGFAPGCGTVFELSPPSGKSTQWRERVLWSFGADGDGAVPAAGLIADKWGNLYGTTTAGGTHSCTQFEFGPGCGTVFELSPPAGKSTQWRERVLWSFAGAPEDGTVPFAGTVLRRGPNPILNLRPPEGVSRDRQRRTLDYLRRLNEMNRDDGDTELSARIASYELAFRMQQHAPEAVDLARETAATRRAYGLDDARTADFGTRCLLARRLVERGVRFVQLYSGGGPLITQWDAHDDINSNHGIMCGRVDQPVAALLKDLKQRGLLDTTLVVWASEFGRTPHSQGARGRDHNPYGYTMWLAGGGVQGGQAIGATDELGLRAVENRISVNDFHATILHLLGLDHERLTYLHNGRDERLTDVAGRVVSRVVREAV